MDAVLERWARIALCYDTALSRAMLKALGVPARKPEPKTVLRHDRYGGVRECMGQRFGVML